MQENIQAFIDYDNIGKPTIERIKGSVFVLLFFGIPTSLVGNGKEWMKIVILPIIVLTCFWGLSFFSQKKNNNKKEFCLYMCFCQIEASFFFIAIPYKILSAINAFATNNIIILLVALLLFLLIDLYHNCRQIKNGFYSKEPQYKKKITPTIGYSFLGLAIARLFMLSGAGMTLVYFVIAFCIFLAVLFTDQFIKHLLKYALLKIHCEKF